mgnify:CR=1 FL=1
MRCLRGSSRMFCVYSFMISFRVATLFSYHATPCFGRLLMDKRLHRSTDGFVLSRSSLHVCISRFGIVAPRPPVPPVFNVVVCVAFVFVCPCLSLLMASLIRSPILNVEGCGEFGVLCLVIVAVPLAYFSGAIFCPSTVKMIGFFMHAPAFQNEFVTLR